MLATWFWIGRMPFAPGTWGSVAALPLAYILYLLGGGPAVLAGAVVAFLVGWWATARYVTSPSDDPKEVVIDEVAGQLLALSMVTPGIVEYIAGFALFRLFDIAKPWPVGWADKRVKGPLGVMIDDVLAGVYAAAILFAAIYFWKAS